MGQFSQKSLDRLNTCHPDLQHLFVEVVKNYDCAVICGHRNKEDQDEAVLSGKSQVEYPHSKHNSFLSLAVDVVPFPIDWNDTNRFYHFAGYVLGVAKELGIKVRWGGDWDGDLNFRDEKFRDFPHYELLGLSESSK